MNLNFSFTFLFLKQQKKKKRLSVHSRFLSHFQLVFSLFFFFCFGPENFSGKIRFKKKKKTFFTIKLRSYSAFSEKLNVLFCFFFADIDFKPSLLLSKFWCQRQQTATKINHMIDNGEEEKKIESLLKLANKSLGIMRYKSKKKKKRQHFWNFFVQIFLHS